MGPYVADFAAHKQKLVIEVDGEFHFTNKGIRKTKERDEWFAARGYDVLHIDTGELSRNFEGCITSILFKLGLMN